MTSETHTFVHPQERRARQHEARRGLLVFGSLLVPLSLLGYWLYNMLAESGPPLLPSLALMAAPALASAITRLVLREGFADVSFRLGGRASLRAIMLGLAVPLLVGGLAYGVAFLAGLAEFAPPELPFAASLGPAANFALTIGLAATLGTLVLLPTAAGEEIGWRGYLLPRLIGAGVPHPVLLSGLIWGAWHLVPLFASGYAAGPSPLFSATNLMVASVSFGFILAWMRLGTGSIWPSVVGHAAWNATINGGFMLVARGETASLWVGEGGFLVMLALVGAALVIGRISSHATEARRAGLP